MQTYGIPGNMIQVDTTGLKNCLDPVPGLMKQLVTREDDKMLIQYECASKLGHSIVLPAFKHIQCTNFIFYCHSPDAGSQIHKENYQCFLKHAWPEARDDETFFVCILHNVDKNFGCNWLSKNTVVFRRPNIGLDFGAYCDGLHFTGLDQVDIKEERKLSLFFMNDTVFGPTFPWWIKPRPKWTELFQNMLNDQVKLAGMTINPYRGRPHVQSMLMVTDQIGLALAMKAKVFARRIDKEEIIDVCEVGFSSAILQGGFNIDCAAELLHGYDYRLPANIPTEFTDVTFNDKYGGFSIHPLETVFSKTNRMNRELAHKLQTAHEQKKDLTK